MISDELVEDICTMEPEKFNKKWIKNKGKANKDEKMKEVRQKILDVAESIIQKNKKALKRMAKVEK